jgi:hypothetical protein
MNALASLVYDHETFNVIDLEITNLDNLDFLKLIHQLFQNTSEKIETILLDSPLIDWV